MTSKKRLVWTASISLAAGIIGILFFITSLIGVISYSPQTVANASYSDSASYPAILGIINALRLLLPLAYSGLLWASFGLGIAAINYYKNDARYDQRISILLILSVAIAYPGSWYLGPYAPKTL